MNEPGIKITWHSTVLYAGVYRTKEQNLWAAKLALCILNDMAFEEMFERKLHYWGGITNFEEGGGKIETYRSY